MAKKITAVVKLQLPAGKATPGPPVGSSLGPHGINIPAVTKENRSVSKTKISTRKPIRTNGTNKIGANTPSPCKRLLTIIFVSPSLCCSASATFCAAIATAVRLGLLIVRIRR